MTVDVDNPPPMPAPPKHEGCDPEALGVDPVNGWVCWECGAILGGLENPAPASSKLPAQQQDPRDPIGGALRVLDPSVVQGPQEFTEQILYMVERCGAAEFAQRLATHELAEAETAYRRAYDRAVVERRGQGSADVRAAEARVQCDAELTRVEHAKAILTAIKGAAHSWRSMISGYQTAAGLVRDAYGASGRYGGQGY